MLQRLFKTALGAMLTLSISALCASDWPSVNFNRKNSRNNKNETILNPGNVGNLQLLWATPPLPGLVNVPPVIANDVVYFGDTLGNFFAKNVNDGSDVYGPIVLDGPIEGPVTVVGNTIYATTSNLKLYAFNLDLSPKVAFNGGFVIIDPASVGLAQVYAGPVVVDNIVIIPITSNGAEIYFNLFPTIHGGISAFNATTGEFLWRTPITAPDQGAAGGAWSTPSVDKNLKRIYVGTTNALSPPAGDHTAALLSLDYLTGDIVWSRQFTSNAVWGVLYPCGNDFDVGASPNNFKIETLFGNKKVVGVNSKAGVYRVFERDSGDAVWHTKVIPDGQNRSINGNPSAAVDSDTVYAICNYDTSGLPINVLNIYLVMAGPVIQPQAFVQFLSSFTFYDHAQITALNKKNGHIKWTNDSVGSTLASITVANGVLYTGNFNGIFRALNSADGSLLFMDSIGLPVSSPISVVDGKAFVATGIVNPDFTQTGGTLRVYALPTP